ncbi:hypothetical protein [Allofranklinella schreckenbergeri]|uniref:hypothetical protein n=1 Tax=Allofranklinella schreckenbergeri TaxID=1076744 RepID=UPI0011C47EAF|nr:hypothetical protein [Allofranklinella schreckenbergeri]
MTPVTVTFKSTTWPVFLGFSGILLLAYTSWYLGVWPGPVGEDGYALLANIDQGVPRFAGKEPAWILYALATYGTTGWMEMLVIPMILVQIAIFARILSWIYAQGYRKTALSFLLLIACTPHVLNFATGFYPDSVFSLAFVGILFEVWLGLKVRKISPGSALAIALLLPVAAFFKANGILIFVPVLYLACRLRGLWRWFLVLACIFWVLAVQLGGKLNDLGKGHGALKPLILFETVNFMQSRPMGLWENRHMVTDETKQVVYRYISQQSLDDLFDRDYWDTLWHQNHDRVKFRQMTREDRQVLRHEFFTYNLWRNLPVFFSSRVNIFLASALAQGGMVGPSNAKHYVEKINSASRYNFFELEAWPIWIDDVFQRSYNWRFLWWTPFFGVFLIFLCSWLAVRQKNWDDGLVAWAMLLQLGGIFMFSIAAEYRYMLLIFYSPLLLVPMWYLQKCQDGSSNKN